MCRRSLSYSGSVDRLSWGIIVAILDSRCMERNIEFQRVSFGVTKPIPSFSSTKSEAFGLLFTLFHRADACENTGLARVLYRPSDTFSMSLATRFKVWVMHLLWGGRQGASKSERGAGSISSSSSELSLAGIDSSDASSSVASSAASVMATLAPKQLNALTKFEALSYI